MRNRCNGEGYESVALIPLRASGETFGLLQLNDHRKGRFTPRGISLLERLADSVAIGLRIGRHRIRCERAKRSNAASSTPSAPALPYSTRKERSLPSTPHGSILPKKTARNTLFVPGWEPTTCKSAARAPESSKKRPRRPWKVSRACWAENSRTSGSDPCHSPGVERWFLMHATPLCDGKRGVIVAHVDVTQLAEEALRRSEKMQAEAEKLAATGRMAARIAHEMNNPLAGIKSAYRLVRDAVPEDHPDRDMVERIDREIDRISKIVQQMYTLYSPKAGKNTEALVADVVRDVLSMLEPMRRESEVQFDTTGVLPGLNVRVPEGGLHQIVFNLLANATEASPPGGVISIAAELNESRADLVEISVHDQGKGIPPENQLRIFATLLHFQDR